MTTDAEHGTMDAREIKEGDRLLIRYPDRDDMVVVVDDVVENSDGGVDLTVSPE